MGYGERGANSLTIPQDAFLLTMQTTHISTLRTDVHVELGKRLVHVHMHLD
jgi:hypothetical protein